MDHRHLHRKGVPYYELYQSQLTIKALTTRDSGKEPFNILLIIVGRKPSSMIQLDTNNEIYLWDFYNNSNFSFSITLRAFDYIRVYKVEDNIIWLDSSKKTSTTPKKKNHMISYGWKLGIKAKCWVVKEKLLWVQLAWLINKSFVVE